MTDLFGDDVVDEAQMEESKAVTAKLQRLSVLKRDISTPCNTPGGPGDRTRSNHGQPAASKVRVEE